MATSKIQTGLRLEEEALKKITYIAKKEKRSLNSVLEYAAQKYIDEFEKTHGNISLQDLK